MTHLTSDELIDAMEADHGNTSGMLAPERQSHLVACDACRRQLAELSGVLSEAKQTSVPEPSPLFWQHFSQRVRVAIDQAPTPGSNWPAWLRWQVLLPLGAMAMIVLALAFNLARTSDVPEQIVEDLAPAMELPADNWVMLTELVGDLDIETASAAGVIEPGVADRAVLELTAEEQQELTRLLKAELTRAKS